MKKKEKEDQEKHPPQEEETKETPASLEEELENAKKEHDLILDKYLRICADFDNARKRWEREKEEVVKFANFTLLKDLIVILDEMEQASKMIKEHKDIEEISKGLEIMLKNFTSTLKKRGIKQIESEGKKFDPHLHEIVATKDVDDAKGDHMVLEEIQKGYLFENKLLRTAKVIVGIKKKEKEIEKEEESEEK